MIHKKAHYDIAQKWKGCLEHWLRCDFLVCRKYNMTQYSRANGRKKYVHVYIHWKIRLKQISNKNNNKHLFSIQKRIIHCILQLHCINIEVTSHYKKVAFKIYFFFKSVSAFERTSHWLIRHEIFFLLNVILFCGPRRHFFRLGALSPDNERC